MNYLSPCGMETRKLVWWKRMQPTKNDIAVAFSLLSLFSRMKILKYFYSFILEKIYSYLDSFSSNFLFFSICGHLHTRMLHLNI